MNTSLIAINAKNIHKSSALWYLKAYCEEKKIENISVIEVNINDKIYETVSKIYETKPTVAAFSCYIWNIDYVNKIAPLLKKLLPNLTIVLGGPEVSFEKDLSDYPYADYIIKGAGEKAFYELLVQIEKNGCAETKIINGCELGFENYPLPYTDDYFNSFQNNQIPYIQNQLVYYESSRGCPFSCAYCLSSTDKGVRYLPIERVKQDLLLFIKHEAKCVKFVDRTFNSDKKRAKQILEFISNLNTDCVFHFEVAADLFDDELLSIVEKLPIERVQFEIGIQTINEKSIAAVSRKTDTALALQNIKKLTSFQNCHIHVDLIAGLPHETLATFAESVNQCMLCRPNMLQLGFLKMLKGTRIRKESGDFKAVFADFAPYEVYQTKTMPHSDFIKLKKIEGIIDRFYNCGGFALSVEYGVKLLGSPYNFFDAFSDYLGGTGEIKLSLKSAYTVLYNFLSANGGGDEAAHRIKFDCFAFDAGASLPDTIPQQRNKQAELSLKKEFEHKKFRVEFFEFKKKNLLFNFEKKNPITSRYESKEITIN
ncbi:MAG: B12-binding domain-containing radical SAM protein [Bacteroidales bacterium]|jgi:radical SAM superfamily enzyme YgiQ (UPF0313 family)|nr:B12-binding domain-containing radical SAM protein [Bacteroidales bacterium]